MARWAYAGFAGLFGLLSVASWIGGILGFVLLWKLWNSPYPALWRWLLGAMVLDWLTAEAVRNAHKMERDEADRRVTVFWLVVATVVRLAMLAIVVWAAVASFRS